MKENTAHSSLLTPKPSLLFRLIRESKFKAAKTSIAAGLKVNVYDRTHETPLIAALCQGEAGRNMALYLIELPNINLSMQSYQYGSALTLAIEIEDQACIQAMLAKIKTFDHAEHPCALVCAVKNEDLATIKLLLSKGANPHTVDRVSMPEWFQHDEYDSDLSTHKREDAGQSAYEVAQKYDLNEIVTVFDAHLAKQASVTC